MSVSLTPAGRPDPAALNAPLEHYFASVVAPANRVDSAKLQYLFNLLYTVYSIPNIVLPFFGGYFTDKLGARLMNVVFCSCLLLGQIVLTAGVFAGSFPLMLLGRVVFGFGGESLCVSQSAIIQQWFMASLSDDCQKKINGVVERSCAARYGVSTHSRNRSHHTAIARDAAEPRSRASEKQLGLAFAMGLNLSLSRVGSTINNYMSPFLANHFATAAGRVVCPHRTLPPPQLDPHASL